MEEEEGAICQGQPRHGALGKKGSQRGPKQSGWDVRWRGGERRDLFGPWIFPQRSLRRKNQEEGNYHKDSWVNFKKMLGLDI